jgi:exonuclease SbcC
LSHYDDLDSTLKSCQDTLTTLTPDYERYLQHHPLAVSLDQEEQTYQTLAAEIHQKQGEYQEQEVAYNQQKQDYSPTALVEAEGQEQQLRSQRDYLAGSLQSKQTNLEGLERLLAQRQQWHRELEQVSQELTQKKSIYQFIKDIRTIYNQSGPRVTRYYLDEICQEADRLFRELMNRPGVALQWTEDYEIQVQEEHTWRSFRTLSGGEQTTAALAVRLALLKVIADLDIAFFDEPTTNLDRDRRQALADTLANLKSFRQLFVISHDDTFETLTENIIRIDR